MGTRNLVPAGASLVTYSGGELTRPDGEDPRSRTSEHAASSAESSPWAPLGSATFAFLWPAVLVGDLGTWMQTVGAQWLLVSAPNAGALVALVQTADTLPIMLLALPPGVLADELRPALAAVHRAGVRPARRRARCAVLTRPG